jgi:hypothetical protein
LAATLSRVQLISRTAKGGAALLLAGGSAGPLARLASADSIPDADLAYARLLISAELLASDFYSRAVAAKQFSGSALEYLKHARDNERAHYRSVAAILTGAGETAATSSDFDFSYPKGSFGSRSTIAKRGVRLETIVLGAYLGAVDGLQTPALKQPMARIAASEAQHLSLFSELAGGDPVGNSFPRPLAIDEASNALDAYTS